MLLDYLLPHFIFVFYLFSPVFYLFYYITYVLKYFNPYESTL